MRRPVRRPVMGILLSIAGSAVRRRRNSAATSFSFSGVGFAAGGNGVRLWALPSQMKPWLPLCDIGMWPRNFVVHAHLSPSIAGVLLLVGMIDLAQSTPRLINRD